MKELIYYTMTKNGHQEKEYDVIHIPENLQGCDLLIYNLRKIQKIEDYWKSRGYDDFSITDISDWIEQEDM